MSRSSLLYLNLYFTTHLGNDSLDSIYKRNYIHAAANKAALGQVVSIIVRDTDKQIKINLSNSLLQKANSVHDFKSFCDYVAFSYLADSNSVEIAKKQIDTISGNREKARNIFLVANIIGSILLLIGFKFE